MTAERFVYCNVVMNLDEFNPNYHAIVGPMMTISVRNSKSQALLFWGRIIRSKVSSTGIGPRFVQK